MYTDHFFALIILAHRRVPPPPQDAKVLDILCTMYMQPEVLSPEADLRMRPSMHTHNREIEKRSGEEQYEPWTESQLNLR